jgi:hypothetical protein
MQAECHKDGKVMSGEGPTTKSEAEGTKVAVAGSATVKNSSTDRNVGGNQAKRPPAYAQEPTMDEDTTDEEVDGDSLTSADIKRIGDWNVTPITAYLHTKK